MVSSLPLLMGDLVNIFDGTLINTNIARMIYGYIGSGSLRPSRAEHLLSIFRNGSVHIHIDPRINFKINLHPHFNKTIKKKSNTNNIMLKNIAPCDASKEFVYSLRKEYSDYIAPITDTVATSPPFSQTTTHSVHKKLGKYLKKINISALNSMKVIDKDFNDSQLYCLTYNDAQYLLTNKKQIVGTVYSWVDECEEVPIDYKTTDNIVLHPNNQLPIIEIQITKVGSMYANINNGIYREYYYDDELECFRKTNNIISDIMA